MCRPTSIWSPSRRKCFEMGVPLTSVPLVLPRSSRKESARIVTTAACSPLTARLGRQKSLSARRPIVIRSRLSGTSSTLPSARNRTSLLMRGLLLCRLLAHPALQPAPGRKEALRDADQHHLRVVAAAILIGDVDQLGGSLGQVAALASHYFLHRRRIDHIGQTIRVQYIDVF